MLGVCLCYQIYFLPVKHTPEPAPISSPLELTCCFPRYKREEDWENTITLLCNGEPGISRVWVTAQRSLRGHFWIWEAVMEASVLAFLWAQIPHVLPPKALQWFKFTSQKHVLIIFLFFPGTAGSIGPPSALPSSLVFCLPS